MFDGYEDTPSGGRERGERVQGRPQVAKRGGTTWVLNPGRGMLSKLQTKRSPPSRIEASMVYLKALRCWLLLGGKSIGNDMTQKTDAWIFSSASMTWTPLQGSMPFAKRMAVWYDPVHERVLMVSEKTGAMWALKVIPEWAKP